MMQVPSSITLNNNGNATNQKHQSIYNNTNHVITNAQFNMDIPDKLTSRFLKNKKNI